MLNLFLFVKDFDYIRIMRILFISILLLFSLQTLASEGIQELKDSMYNRQGKPSTYGINYYVNKNSLDIIKEYEYLIDTLYDVYIFTDNLKETSDDDLGEFYIPDQIVITNQEKYIAYEFRNLSKFKQKITLYNERTVKAVIFHELTHAYVNQLIYVMKQENKIVSSEYGALRMFPNPATRFGAEFIEEGICEYAVYFLHESKPIKNNVIPQTLTDITDGINRVNILYVYSVYVLQNFLDKYGLKKGIEILLGNKPPTPKEMLKPELFFNRLKIN